VVTTHGWDAWAHGPACGRRQNALALFAKLFSAKAARFNF
jgi:hypothetical protein